MAPAESAWNNHDLLQILEQSAFLYSIHEDFDFSKRRMSSPPLHSNQQQYSQ
jgi:hypothetical protein